MENMKSSEPRARLSFDLDEDDFLPSAVEPSKELVEKKVQEISKKSGFTATVAPKEVPASIVVPPVAVMQTTPDFKKIRRRAKTGRTYPFNTKLKEETYESICTLADSLTEKEGRPVSLAEVIERSIDLLKKKQ
jgi:hypothetical protein